MNVQIEESWKAHLEPEFDKDYFRTLTDFVKSEYSQYQIFPPGKLIFNAFNLCPFDKVKVVIIGQDPYHGPGQAHGLCFSVNDGVPFPPSLVNIFKEIKADIGTDAPATGNLTRWAEQGVLLLNATLTVRAHQAGSHQNRGWETFTDAAIRALAEEKENLVFILWGSYAQKKGALALIYAFPMLAALAVLPLGVVYLCFRAGEIGNGLFVLAVEAGAVYLFIKYKRKGKKEEAPKNPNTAVLRTEAGGVQLGNPFRGVFVLGAAGSGKSESIAVPLLSEFKAILEGKTTSVEATQAVLDKIAAGEDTYHCYVTVEREKALKQAEEVQKKIEAGELTGPLAGVPFAIKDNMCTEGTLTTCSSKILENFVPTFSAEAVLNLEKAGAVILGKTNMDEFAMGSTTETSYYGVTKNPRNPEHVPGGSSGGSAAAVAAQECFAALGSDTGGSIRQPASYCGVVGMKPTYGTVSRYGLIAYGSSLDQIGPLTKDVTDCATVLEAITSHDPKDSTSMKRENTDFTSALVADVKGMKIGIPRDYFGEGQHCCPGVP